MTPRFRRAAIAIALTLAVSTTACSSDDTSDTAETADTTATTPAAADTSTTPADEEATDVPTRDLTITGPITGGGGVPQTATPIDLAAAGT